MNNRSSVNESNLVNFSAELPTLNQLDAKDGLLTFPFDHIYACHSEEGSDRSQSLQLDKEIEITTHCETSEPQPSPGEVAKLQERLSSFERQNKALKALVLYHLDLIQQQNELMTKRDKLLATTQQENQTLKSRLTRADRRLPVGQRQGLNPPPLVPVPPPVATVTSKTIKTEPASTSEIMLNSFPELVLPDNKSYIFESDLNKPKSFAQDPFELPKTTPPEVTYLTNELSVSKLLSTSNLNIENKYTVLDHNRAFNMKKEIKTEKHSEPMYTVTSNRASPAVQRNPRSRKRTGSGLSGMTRMAAPPTPKVEPKKSTNVIAAEKKYERMSVNKKSKMINTYGKSKSSKLKSSLTLTGSLCDRLRLIDTTPTGEDPYALREADMRDHSPIPKLKLLKTTPRDPGRLSAASARFYESQVPLPLPPELKDVKLGQYNLTNSYVHPDELIDEVPKPAEVEDVVKPAPQLNWRMYSKPGKETSLCDFSYGETSNNLASNLLPSLDTVDFQNLFSSDSTLNLESLNQDIYPSPEKTTPNKLSKRGVRTNSIINSNNTNCLEGATANQIGIDNRTKRKRTLSTTGSMKTIKREISAKVIGPLKPKTPKGGKAVCREKKSAVPGMITDTPYHTLVGDPDLSWYLGLDPDVKMEDIDPPGDSKASTVEVPRWREKPYTSCYSLEGTENLDDKVFEKRHQKLEAEERRQLRWHMRRVREQRQMERLRQRHRDSWCEGDSAPPPPAAYTVWPQPRRDARFLLVTDTLPVTAFGEILPALPDSDFCLPWVRTSKALKKSKRSKTIL